MCVSAYVFRRGREPVEVHGVRELRRLLGWRPPILPDYPHINMERGSCLCPVDFYKLGRLAGWKVERPEWCDDTDHFDGWALREDTPRDA